MKIIAALTVALLLAACGGSEAEIDSTMKTVQPVDRAASGVK